MPPRHALAGPVLGALGLLLLAACGLSSLGTGPSDGAPAPQPGADSAVPPADASVIVDSGLFAAPDGGQADSGGLVDSSGTDSQPATDSAAAPDTSVLHSITFVQAVVVPVVEHGNPQEVATQSFNVAGGDLLVVAAYWASDSDSMASVTDTGGGAWTAIPSAHNSGCNGQVSPWWGQIWYAPNAAAGSHLVTLTTSANDTAMGFVVLEYSGVAASGALDTQGSDVPTSDSQVAAAGSVTTTGALDVVVALLGDLNGVGQMTATAGYAARASDVSFYSMVEDNLPGTGPGSSTASATLPNPPDSCWLGVSAAFKAR